MTRARFPAPMAEIVRERELIAFREVLSDIEFDAGAVALAPSFSHHDCNVLNYVPVDLKYPPEYVHGHHEGSCVLTVYLGDDGSTTLSDVQCSHETFEMAIKAASWSFQSSLEKNEGATCPMVGSEFKYPVEFRLAPN